VGWARPEKILSSGKAAWIIPIYDPILAAAYHGDMEEIPKEVQPRPTRTFRTILLTLVLIAIAFGAGYVPQWLEARRLRTSLNTITLELRLANLHRQLGVASHEAQRNNYANAADAARVFFDGCRALSREEVFAGQPRTREAISAYAGYADDIVPRLISGDPLVREKLAGLYLAMDGVLKRRL
jgi:hypothetical protein